MDIKYLKEIENLNELDLLYKMIEIATENKKDTEKILSGCNIAGIRVRSKLQDIRLLCEIIRDKIQIRKNVYWSENKKNALEKAIKKAEEKEEKDKELIRKRKEERINRIRNGIR